MRLGGISIYTDLAYVYDRLMDNINAEWAEYIEEIFNENNLSPSLILDLGYGTGSFCIEMADRGYDMIGIDISCMLARKNKSLAKGHDIFSLIKT